MHTLDAKKQQQQNNIQRESLVFIWFLWQVLKNAAPYKITDNSNTEKQNCTSDFLLPALIFYHGHKSKTLNYVQIAYCTTSIVLLWCV